MSDGQQIDINRWRFADWFRVPESQTVAPCGCRVRWLRIHLSRIPHLDERHREGRLDCVQPIQVADGALRLHGNVVSTLLQPNPTQVRDAHWRTERRLFIIQLQNASIARHLMCPLNLFYFWSCAMHNAHTNLK